MIGDNYLTYVQHTLEIMFIVAEQRKRKRKRTKAPRRKEEQGIYSILSTYLTSEVELAQVKGSA